MHRVHDCSVQWLVLEENIAADTLKTSIQFPHSIIPISFCTLQNFLNLNIKSHGNISLVPVWTPLSPVPKSAGTTVLGTSSWQLRAVILTITSQAAALPSRRAERRWVASFRGNTDFPKGRSGFFFASRTRQVTVPLVRINTPLSSEGTRRWKTQPLCFAGRHNVSMRLARVYSISKSVKSFCC